MGVGFGKNPRALKITVIERIIWAWILTIPAAGGFAYGLFRLIEALGWA
jgi:inorganic phosphate transporter, PiT family